MMKTKTKSNIQFKRDINDGRERDGLWVDCSKAKGGKWKTK
jgi:hypothetical protein